MSKEEALKNVLENPMDAVAWQALGKVCGWMHYETDMRYTNFFQINLAKGWNAAVEYLLSLISSKLE